VLDHDAEGDGGRAHAEVGDDVEDGQNAGPGGRIGDGGTLADGCLEQKAGTGAGQGGGDQSEPESGLVQRKRGEGKADGEKKGADGKEAGRSGGWRRRRRP
jgi:hypothetical protein